MKHSTAPTSDESPILSLAERVCTGNLDATGYAQLSKLLDGDPDSQKAYVDYLRTYVALKELCDERGQAPAPKLDSVRIGRRRIARLVGLGAIAAAILLCTSSVIPRVRTAVSRFAASLNTDSLPRQVASITRSFGDARWLIGRERQGLTVVGGQVIDVRVGQLEMRCVNGTRLVAKAPAQLTFEDGSHVRLTHGMIRVVMGRHVESFKVSSESLEVIDLGTEFFVDVRADDVSSVYVREGRCRVANLLGESLVANVDNIVEAGHAALVGDDQRLAVLGQSQSFDEWSDRVSHFLKLDTGIAGHSPSVRLVGTEDDVAQTNLLGGDKPHALVISERRGVCLEQALPTGESNRTIPVNTRLDSYLITSDFGPPLPPDASKLIVPRLQYRGFITFESRIAAVIATRSQFDVTDPLFRTEASRRRDRSGMLESSDYVRLSEQSNLLEFEFRHDEGDADQIRVLVYSDDSSLPQSTGEME